MHVIPIHTAVSATQALVSLILGCVDQSIIVLATRHWLRTVSSATENTAIWELVDHSTLSLFAYLNLRNIFTNYHYSKL